MKLAPVLAAIEDAWDAIRLHHPQIPDKFISLQRTDEPHGGWADEFGVVVTTHTLDRDGEGVLGTLLHEAAHVLADERGINDVRKDEAGEISEASYHNKRYKMLAEEVGLKSYSMKDKVNGWHTTMLTDATENEYASVIAALDRALKDSRTPQP